MAKTTEKTLWETEGRNFTSDLDYGKEGERRVAKHFARYRNVVEVRDISNSKRGIDDDIDFEILYTDGHTCTIEVKTDTRAHETGNFAYEEFSHNNPGCFARTKADHIIYLIAQSGEAYVLNPEKFRKFIAEMKANPAKAKLCRVRAAKMGEGASGYLVPIKSILATNNEFGVKEAIMTIPE